MKEIFKGKCWLFGISNYCIEKILLYWPKILSKTVIPLKNFPIKHENCKTFLIPLIFNNCMI